MIKDKSGFFLNDWIIEFQGGRIYPLNDYEDKKQ
jgi:hypothetical protein